MKLDTTPTAYSQIVIPGTYTNLGTLDREHRKYCGIDQWDQLPVVQCAGSREYQHNPVYPPVPAGLQWTNKLAVDGTIALLCSLPHRP